MALFISESFYASIDPIAPYKLSRHFGLNEEGIGEFFLHLTVVVIVASVFLLLVPHKTDKYFFILVGYLLLTVGTFLTGPSKLLGLPNSLSLMKAGMCVCGVGVAPLMSLGSVFAYQSGEKEFPQSSD